MNLLRKSLLMVTAMATALLVAPSQQQSRGRVPADPTSTSGVQFGGLANTNPGLKIRMTQSLSDLVKHNLLMYGVSYMNWDLDIPEQGVRHISAFPVYTDIHYSNLLRD